MTDKEIVKELIGIYGNQILDVYELPSVYNVSNSRKVEAIYLGCDPSNKYCNMLPFVFAHHTSHSVFTKFLLTHYDQLEEIGLNWDNVYAQNLCRNYFKEETSKNRIWKKVATEYWIDKLKEELSQFDLKLPVLLTAQVLLEVLGTDGYEKIKASQFYECRQAIPIPADKNKLNRELIPLYRGKSPKFETSYLLKDNKKWEKYRESIKSYLEEKKIK